LRGGGWDHSPPPSSSSIKNREDRIDGLKMNLGQKAREEESEKKEETKCLKNGEQR
jgi:hypothetical protein